MTSENRHNLHIKPSKESQSELEKFLRVMQTLQKTVKTTEKDFSAIAQVLSSPGANLGELKADLKQIKLLVDGLKRGSIGKRGVGTYLDGEAFRADRQVAGTNRLGTGIGQKIALQKEEVSLAKQGLSFARQAENLDKARLLNLRMQARQIEKISDVEKARQLAAAAELRMGMEAAAGNARRAKSAERILNVAQQRVQTLNQERKTIDSLAKAEERRKQQSDRAEDALMERVRKANAAKRALQGSTSVSSLYGTSMDPTTMEQGANFRQGMAATRQANAGTPLGQQIAGYQEITRQTKEMLRFTKQKQAVDRAATLNLNTTAEQVRKIKDLEVLSQNLAAAKNRVLMERARQDLTAMARAQRLVTLYEMQHKKLSAAKKEKERLNRLDPTGTAAGRDGVTSTEMLRGGKRANTHAQNQLMAQMAEALNLQKIFESVGKITKQEQVRHRIMLLQARAQLEGKRGQQQTVTLINQSIELHKKQLTLLQQQAREEERKAKAAEKRAKQIRSNHYGDRQLERSQAVAGWRRTQDRLGANGGAQLFMTQATLMANYAAMNAGRNAVSGGASFTADLDESLRNLQAITVVTDENLMSLREQILQVSEATKFFATDIANAAVTLGQAGFSTKEIEDSISAVALLATATGTDLAQSVDLTTSILGVFRMESAQMVGVADTLTAAVNNSKLNIEKLTLGMQYAGNIASQSGVSFEELTASLGAMANAGIRSGSTLGTGMRQILIALQKPSGEFKETLDRLGLTLSDVNLRSNGLYGVMQNLKEGGFTAGDAIRSFEVRAAAAFNALSGNLNEVVKLERAFLNSTAAAKANETQMRALSNQGRRFQANLQAVVSTGLEPLSYALRDFLSWMANGLEAMRQAPGALRGIVTWFAAVTAGLIAAKAAWTALNIVAIITGLKSLWGTLMAARAGSLALSAAIAPMGVVLAGAATGVYFLSKAFGSYNSEIAKSQDKVAKAQTAFDNLSGAAEGVGSQIEMVDDRIKSLSDRSELEDNLLALETDKVREQFHAMGLKLDENVDSVDDLIAALRSLRGELADEFVIKMTRSVGALEDLMKAEEGNYETLRTEGSISNFTRNPGVYAHWKREGIGDLVGMAQEAGQKDAPVSTLQDTRAAVLAAAANGEFNRSTEKFLEKMVTDLDSMIQSRLASARLGHQLKDQQDSAANAQNRVDNDGFISKVRDFSVSRDVRINNAADRSGGDALDRHAVGSRELLTMEDEGADLLKAIEGHKDLNETVKAELKQEVQNALATAREATAALSETAQEVAEDAAEAEILRQEAKINRGNADLSRQTDASSIKAVGADVEKAIKGRHSAELDALLAEYKFDKGDANYQGELDRLLSEQEQELKKHEKDVRGYLAEQKALSVRELRVQEGHLKLALETELDPTKREDLRSALTRVMVKIADEEKARLALTIEAANELAIAQSEVDQNTSAALQGISQEQSADDVSAAEKDLEIAERALQRVIELAQTAKTNKELAEAQAMRTKALADYAAAANALTQVKIETGTTSSEDAEGDLADDLATKETSVDKAFTAATNRVKRRGGGGYSKNRDEIDKLLDELKSKIELAENYVAVGKDVGDQFDDAFETALSKAREIGAQIDTLHNKMQAGGLTVSEQQKLNDLIDKQARLTSFIADQEMAIARSKMQQGHLMTSIRMTAKAWSRENLDMAKTMQEGIVSGLDNAKNALAEFFTTWSDGTKSGKEAFKDLTVSILKSIQQIIAEMLAVAALKQILGLFGVAMPGGAAAGGGAGGLREGGRVKKAAMGTHVQGNLNRDSQRYDLMPGEYVLRRSAVQAIGVDELDRINAMGNSSVQTGQLRGAAQPKPTSAGPKGGMNIYLVDERSQAGALGPQDIIAVIGNDIATGGTTKKLIKHVQAGAI